MPSQQPTSSAEADWGAWQLDISPAAKVLAAGSLASLLPYLALSGLPLWAQAAWLAIGCVVLLKRMFGSVLLMVGLCFAYELVMAWRFPGLFAFLQPGDNWRATALLGFVVLASRYVAAPRPGDAGREGANGADTAKAADNALPAPAGPILRPLSLSLLRIPLAVVLAMLCLAVFSNDAFYPNRYRFAPGALRGVALAWVITIAIVLPLSLLSVIRWRQLQRSQAELFVRRVALDELTAGQSQVEQARAAHLKRLEELEQ
jgi:hypothetical protein